MSYYYIHDNDDIAIYQKGGTCSLQFDYYYWYMPGKKHNLLASYIMLLFEYS